MIINILQASKKSVRVIKTATLLGIFGVFLGYFEEFLGACKFRVFLILLVTC